MSSFFISSETPGQASKPRNIKSSNIKLILSMLDSDTAITATEISVATNLSKTTVSKIFSALQSKKLLVSAGKGSSTNEGGKKPELFTINASYRHVIVIQLSELLYIECSVLNLACKIKGSLKVETPPTVSYEEAIDIAAGLVCQLKKQFELNASDICDIMVSCEGVVDTREGVIRRPAHHKWGANLPIAKDLAQALGFDARVSIDNVCRYGGYAELMFRENREISNLIVIWNDDLVGGCVLVDRRMVQGGIGLIGEIGHITVNPDSDVRCSCGAYGCFEPLVSCERLHKIALNTYVEYPDSALFSKAKYGTLVLSDIFDAANSGDRFAMQLVDSVTSLYAVLIRNISAFHDPQKIILQGVYAAAGDYFYRSLHEKVAKNTIRGVQNNIIISPSSYHGGVPRTIGAAFYAVTQFFNSDVLREETEGEL